VTPDPAGMRAPGGTLWGYPKGIYLLSFTELWERFSYYGLMALLVLYLSASVESGGFGWTQAGALKLYGLYTGLAFAGPVLGGWIASRFWGEQRCILVGGVLIVIGHFCLAGPALIPWLAQRLTDVDYRQLWIDAKIPITLLLPTAAAQRLAAAGDVSVLVHRLTAASFFCGLLLIISGTAFIKSTVSSIVGNFFSAGDPRRDGAFAVFMTGIYVGIIAGVVIAGYLGERWGWHLGFGAAGVGMGLGLAVYLWKQRTYLADIGLQAPRRHITRSGFRGLSAAEWDRVKLIFLQGAITAVFTSGSNQSGGLLTLFARDHVDRWVGNFEIPASWLLIAGSCLFVITAPPMARLWERLARRGRNPSASTKLAWGLMVLGLGYAIITLATTLVPYESGAKVPVGWMIAMYACFGFAEVLVYANQLSLTSKLAPPGLAAVFVGGWYIQAAVGNSLTGYIGAKSYTWGLEPVLVGSTLAFIVLGVAVWLATPLFVRLMRGIES
jgi:POT family proton-dependent oligopeptide transporter